MDYFLTSTGAGITSYFPRFRSNFAWSFNAPKNVAIGHVSIVFQKYQNQEFEDVAYFEPFFLKDFVSTQKK